VYVFQANILFAKLLVAFLLFLLITFTITIYFHKYFFADVFQATIFFAAVAYINKFIFTNIVCGCFSGNYIFRYCSTKINEYFPNCVT